MAKRSHALQTARIARLGSSITPASLAHQLSDLAFARDVVTAHRTMASEGRLWGGRKPLLFSEVVEIAT
jgi:hypothetical protein